MIQPQRTFSPFAPPGLAGIPDLDTSQYTYRPHTFVFIYEGIGVNATVVGQFQVFDNDSDFFWRGITTTATNNGGTNAMVAMRFTDPNGVYMSDDFVSDFGQSAFYINEPFPLVPAVYCPSGSRILIDLQDQSGLGNDVQINFVGVKRYSNG